MFRVLHLFTKSLTRIAVALEELRDLYKLDLASRNITQIYPQIQDEVEIMYGSREDQ